MPTNIEKIQHENEEIKKALDALKAMAQSSEKEKKKSELDERIQKAQQEAQSEFQKESDATAREKIKEEQGNLENYSAELKSLKSAVNTTSQAPATTPKAETPQEKKGAWDSTKEFVSENWNAVFDKEKRSSETGKNLLRTAGFVGTGVGAFMLIKKGRDWMFGDDEEKTEKKEEKSDSESDKKDEKSFWKTGRGKFIKWTGIGVGAGTAGYYLGKWLGRWGKEGVTDTDTDATKYQSYEEFFKDPKNKEAVENYEKLGDNIDKLYGSLYQPELAAGYQDELEMQKISKEQSGGEKHYKGIVPFCLDNKYGKIEDILAQNSSMTALMSAGVDQMIDYIKGRGADALQKFASSYLSQLPSWTLLSGFSGTIEEKINEWKTKNQNSKIEMQYFFRQSIRVQTYIFEKREQLAEKIAAEKATKTGRSKEEILENKELFEEYVLNDGQYQAFMSSSLAKGLNVLKSHALFDEKGGEKTTAIVKDLNKDRAEVLGAKEGEKDVLQVIAEKKQKNEQLTDQEKNLLSKSCDAINKEIDDKIFDAVEDGAWNIYGDLLRSDDANIRDYVKKSGLREVFESYKKMIAEKKKELEAGTLPQDQIYALSNSINNMLALKKEVFLGMNTIQQDHDENGNIIYRIPGFLVGSISNLVEGAKNLFNGNWLEGANYLMSAGLGTGVSMVIIGGVVYMFGGKSFGKGMMKTGAAIATFPASALWKIGKYGLKNSLPVRRLGDKINQSMPNYFRSMREFRGEKGPEKLMKAIEHGDIKLSNAADIFSKKLYGLGSGQSEKIWTSYFNLPKSKKGELDLTKHLFDKYVSSTKVGDTFLTKLKADPELYEAVIKNFDNGNEIRLAIVGDEGLEGVKKAVQKVEARASQVASQGASSADDAVETGVKNSEVYKRLDSDLSSELQKLERDLKNATGDAKKAQIEKKIDELTSLKDSLAKMPEKELSETEEVLKLFKGQKNLTHAVEHFNVLKKLEGEKFLSTITDPKTGKGIERTLDDVIKQFDDGAIRSLKGKNIAGVSDEALDVLADTLKVAKTTYNKAVFKNMDEVAVAIKSLVKIIAKAS